MNNNEVYVYIRYIKLKIHKNVLIHEILHLKIQYKNNISK